MMNNIKPGHRRYKFLVTFCLMFFTCSLLAVTQPKGIKEFDLKSLQQNAVASEGKNSGLKTEQSNKEGGEQLSKAVTASVIDELIAELNFLPGLANLARTFIEDIRDRLVQDGNNLIGIKDNAHFALIKGKTLKDTSLYSPSLLIKGNMRPKFAGGPLWDLFIGTELQDPVLALGTPSATGIFIHDDLPGELGKTTRSTYGGTLEILTGIQLHAAMKLKGTLADGLALLNFPSDGVLHVIAGLSKPDQKFGTIPVKGVKTKKKKLKFAQLAHKAGVWKDPLGIPNSQITGTTIYVDSIGRFGFWGNLEVDRDRYLAFYKGPVNVAGTAKALAAGFKSASATASQLLDFQLGFAADEISLRSLLKLLTVSSIGGTSGQVSFIEPVKDLQGSSANTIFKGLDALPLDVIKISNTKLNNHTFKAGEIFPGEDKFNILLLGPLASLQGGTAGPLVLAKGDALILGKRFANFYLELGKSGLTAQADAPLTLGLGQVAGKNLGSLSGNVKLDMKVNANEQELSLIGTINGGVLGGRQARLDITTTDISFNSPATCAFPVTVHSKYTYTDIKTVQLENVILRSPRYDLPDPAKVAKCAGNVYAMLKNGTVYVFNGTTKLVEFAEQYLPPGLDKVPLSNGLKFAGGKVFEAAAEAEAIMGDVIDFAGDIPGVDLAAKAAEEAAKRTAEALDNAAGAASQAANAAYDTTYEGLTTVGGALVDGFSSIGDAIFGSGKNWCNARIEAMRPDELEPDKNDAILMESRIRVVWEAGKRSEAIIPLFNDAQIQIESTQDSFRYLATEWNQFVKTFNTDLYIQQPFTYHNAGKGWISDRSIEQQDTWYYNRGYESLMRRQLQKVNRKGAFGRSIEEYLFSLKHWHEKSNFDPNVDYPGFRCQKRWAVHETMNAALILGKNFKPVYVTLPFSDQQIQIYQNNATWTDLLTNQEYQSALDHLSNTADSMQGNNDKALQYLKDFKVNSVERNIRFINDLKVKLDNSISEVKKRIEPGSESAEEIAKQIYNTKVAINDFYIKALLLAENGASSEQHNTDLKNQMDAVMREIEAVRLAEMNSVLDTFNKPWSSKTKLPTVVLPYVDRCLRSFYRPLDNANPFFVSECHPDLQKVLEDIEQGVARSIDSGSKILSSLWQNAKTGEQYKKENLSYQFWVWNAEQAGTIRLATAVSENSPLATYCLGIPARFGPALPVEGVRALPCTMNDPGQLWKKILDEGGAAYFRLQSIESGLCATWNGLDGVDALVLKECNDANRANQVMTVGWPTREAKGSPKLLEGGKPDQYLLKGFAQSRCISVHKENAKGNNVSAINGRCNPDSGKVMLTKANDDGKYQLKYSLGNQISCLVATDRYTSYFDNSLADKAEPNSYRTVSNGYCAGNNSLWDILHSRDGLYTIREAYGEQQCMYVPDRSFSDNPTAITVMLNDCKDPAPDNRLFTATEVVNSPVNFDTSVSAKTIKATISGTVMASSASGALVPATDILVSLKSAGKRGLYIASARCDESGSFSFSAVELVPGEYILEQGLPTGYSYISDTDDAADGRINVTVAESTMLANNDFVVGKGKDISGKVTAITANGTIPMADQALLLDDNKQNTIDPTVTTDKEGTYIYKFVPPGSYRIIKTLQEGYSDQSNALSKGDGKISIKMKQQDLVGQDFVMLPAAKTISGTVTYKYYGNNDTPLEDVNITLRDNDTEVGQTKTNKEGRYYFYDVPDGNYKIIKSDTYGYVNVSDVDEINDGQITLGTGTNNSLENNFRVKRLTSISGRIKTPLGSGQFKYHKDVKVTLRAKNNSDIETREVLTDKDGWYRFSDFPAGRYIVTITPPAGFTVRPNREFWISDGQKKENRQGDFTDFPICQTCRSGRTKEGESAIWCRQQYTLDRMPQLTPYPYNSNKAIQENCPAL